MQLLAVEGPRIKHERVNISVERGIASVEMVFVMEGTMNYSGELAFPGTSWFEYSDFTAEWNGIKLAVVKETAPGGKSFVIRGTRYPSIYRFTVPRTGADSSVHVIRYSYRVPFADFRKEYEVEGYYIEYILRTGGAWSGSAGTLHVKVKSGADMPCSPVIHPEGSYTGRCTSSDTWEFYAEDIELDRDIRLLYKTGPVLIPR